MRTYIISNIRKHASKIFPINVQPEVYDKNYNRSEVPAIVALLGNPESPNEQYPRYCSVLYKDGVITGTGIFGGVAIIKVSLFPFSVQDLTNSTDPQGDSSRFIVNQSASRLKPHWSSIFRCSYEPSVNHPRTGCNGRRCCKYKILSFLVSLLIIFHRLASFFPQTLNSKT